MDRIEFIDLGAQRRRLGARIDDAMARVVDEGHFIMGPQVAAFERQLGAFCGARHVIGCANGTDAIGLVLMALGLRPGDAVLVPSFTFASTAEAVAWLGAVPVFVDVNEATYTIDPAGLEAGLAAARGANLRPRALIAVDLFGQPASYEEIEAFCAANGLVLICDSAQGFGSSYRGRMAGTIGTVTTASFFPAKPLGCYGDGGAIITDDDGLAATLRSLHVHGKGSDKYDNVRIGVNSRLDTLQAAILIEKLAIFADEIEKRQTVADRYTAGLADIVRTPTVRQHCRSVWAQYTVRLPAAERGRVIKELGAQGIPTAVYYPKPLHRQTAYRDYPVAGNGLPVSDHVAQEVLALPMHPYLDEAAQDRVIAALRTSLQAGASGSGALEQVPASC